MWPLRLCWPPLSLSSPLTSLPAPSVPFRTSYQNLPAQDLCPGSFWHLECCSAFFYLVCASHSLVLDRLRLRRFREQIIALIPSSLSTRRLHSWQPQNFPFVHLSLLPDCEPQEGRGCLWVCSPSRHLLSTKHSIWHTQECSQI